MELNYLHFDYALEKNAFTSFRYSFTFPEYNPKDVSKDDLDKNPKFNAKQRFIDLEELIYKAITQPLSTRDVGVASVQSDCIGRRYELVDGEGLLDFNLSLDFSMEYLYNNKQQVKLSLVHTDVDTKRLLSLYDMILSMPDVSASERTAKATEKIAFLRKQTPSVKQYFQLL